jgi:hypothetical protein
LLAHPDQGFRAAMRWYYRIGRQVWPYELWHWFFHDRRIAHGPTLAEFLGLRSGRVSAVASPFGFSPSRVSEPSPQGSQPNLRIKMEMVSGL